MTAQDEAKTAAEQPNANKSARYMFRDQESGSYQVSDTAPWSNENERMAMGGRVVLGKGPSAQKFTDQLTTEVEAIRTTLAEVSNREVTPPTPSPADTATPTPQSSETKPSEPAKTDNKPYEVTSDQMNQIRRLTPEQVDRSVARLTKKVADTKATGTIKEQAVAMAQLAAYEQVKKEATKGAEPKPKDPEVTPPVDNVTPTSVDPTPTDSVLEPKQIKGKAAKETQTQKIRDRERTRLNKLLEDATGDPENRDNYQNSDKYLQALNNAEALDLDRKTLPAATFDTPDGEVTVYGEKLEGDKSYTWYSQTEDGVSTKLAAKTGPQAVKEVTASLNAVKATADTTTAVFPDSLIQGDVYHTTLEKLEDFKIEGERNSNNDNGTWVGQEKGTKIGFYTTSDIEYSEAFGETTLQLKIDLKNPYEPKENDPIRVTGITPKQREELTKLGYDGIIDGDEYLVFSPNQVKILGSRKNAKWNSKDRIASNKNVTQPAFTPIADTTTEAQPEVGVEGEQTESKSSQELDEEANNQDYESPEERDARIDAEKAAADKENADKFESRQKEKERKAKEKKADENLNPSEKIAKDTYEELTSGMFEQVNEWEQIDGMATTVADWFKNHITLWFNQNTKEPENGTALPLVKEGNFFEKLFDEAGIIKDSVLNKYLKADDNTSDVIRSRQVNVLTLLKFYQTEMQDTIKGLHKKSVRNEDTGNIMYGQRNYVSFLENEDGELPQSVVDAITVAGFEYIAKNGNQRFNDESTMKIMAGIAEQDELPAEIRDELLTVGTRRNMVISELGKAAAASLGLKALRTAPPNAQANLETALGIYALTALMQERPPREGSTVNQPPILEQTQLKDVQRGVDKKQEEIDKEKNPQRKKVLEEDLVRYKDTMQKDAFIRIARDRNEDGVHDPMADARSTFVDVINKGSKETKNVVSRVFGTEEGHVHPEELPGKFKGDIRDENGELHQVRVKKSRMKLPKFLSKVLKKKSRREHYISGEGKKTRGHMSERLALAIAGVKDVQFIQENNKDSHNAKQEQKRRSYENLQEWEAIIEDRPFYFTDSPWINQRVGQLQNLVNMQTDKLHRHSMYMKDWVTEFSITPESSSRMERFFMLSVAQGLGYGTDKEYQAVTIKQVTDILGPEGEYHDVAQIFQQMDRMEEGQTITDEQEQRIEEAIAEMGTEYAAFDALVQYASYANAKEAYLEGRADPTKNVSATFKARAFYEVDGAANGVALSQINMGTGQERGPSYGFFNRQQKEQYGSTVGYKKSNNLDPYQKLISLMNDAIEDEDRGLANSILDILTEGKGAFNEDGSVTGAGRNVVKELVTAVHYGASVENYVNNLGFTMLDGANNYEGWYSQLQDAANEANGANAAIQNQIDRINAVLPTELQIPDGMTAVQAMEFTLSDEQRAAAIAAWQETLAPLMIQAAQTEYGEFLLARDQMNQSANALFEMYNTAFEFLYNKRLEEVVTDPALKDSKGRSKQDLSEAEVNKIYEELGAMSNVVHTPMSQKSGNLDEGIAMEKIHRKFVNEQENGAGYKQSVPFAKGVTFNQDSDSEYPKNAKEMSGMGSRNESQSPGVRAMPLLIMSLDSAVLHASLDTIKALGLHDALAMGLEEADRGARELNKQVYRNLIEYSVPMAVQEALGRAFDARAELEAKHPGMKAALDGVKIRASMDSDTPVVWRADPKKAGKRLPYTYINQEFLNTRRTTAFEARAKSLAFLASIELVDQYVHETGTYEVQPEDQALYETAAQKLMDYMNEQSNNPAPVEEKTPAQKTTEKKVRKADRKKKAADEPYGTTAVEHGLQGNDPVLMKQLEGKTEVTVEEMATALQIALKASLSSGAISKPMYTFQNALLVQMKRMMPADTQILYVSSEQLQSGNYELDDNGAGVKDSFAAMEKSDPNGWAGMTATLTDGTDVLFIRKPEQGSIVNAVTGLHEMVHVVTSRTIVRYENSKGKGLTNPTEKNNFAAVKNLKDLMVEAKKTLEGNPELAEIGSYKYAFTNLSEFVAVGMSDPAFQRDILMKTNIKKEKKTTTGLDAFVKYITDIVFPPTQAKAAFNGMSTFLANSAVLMEASEVSRQVEVEFTKKVKAGPKTLQQLADEMNKRKGNPVTLNPMVVGKYKGNVIEFEMEDTEKAIANLEQEIYGWIASVDEEIEEYENSPAAKKAFEDNGELSVEQLKDFRGVIVEWGALMLKGIQDKKMTFPEAEDYVREKSNIYENPFNVQALQNLALQYFLPIRNETPGRVASPRVQKAINNNASSVLLLRTIQSEGGLQGEIAGFLAKIIKNKHMGIRYSIPSERQKLAEKKNGKDFKLMGQYSSNKMGGEGGFADGQVSLIEDAANEVIVHEFVHSITAVALRNGNGKNGTAAEVRFAKKINELYEIFQIAAEDGGVFDEAGLKTIKEYALINPDEMMAVLLSHPGMMEEASKIRVRMGDESNATIWSELVKAIGDLLGFDSKKANLLSELLKEVAMVNEPIDTLEKAQKQNLDRIREHERFIAQLEADINSVQPYRKKQTWKFWIPTTQENKDAEIILKKLKKALFTYKSFRTQLFDKQVSLNEKLGIDSPVGRGVNETLVSAFNAIRNTSSQPGPDPVSPMDYTTEQIFEELHDTAATPLSQPWLMKLRYALGSVVNVAYGNSGAVRADHLSRTPTGADDVFIQSLVDGKVPFASSLIKIGLSNAEAFTAQSVEMMFQEALRLQTATSTQVRTELKTMREQVLQRIKSPEDLYKGQNPTQAEKDVAESAYKLLTETIDSSDPDRYLAQFAAMSMAYEPLNRVMHNMRVLPDDNQYAGLSFASKLALLFEKLKRMLARRTTWTQQGMPLDTAIVAMGQRMASIEAKKQAMLTREKNSLDAVIENIKAAGETVDSAVSSTVDKVFTAKNAKSVLGSWTVDKVKDGWDDNLEGRQGLLRAILKELRINKVSLQTVNKLHAEMHKHQNKVLTEGANVATMIQGALPVNEAESEAVTFGLLNNDIASLLGDYSLDAIRNFFASQSSLDNEIAVLEAKVKAGTVDIDEYNRVIKQAMDLGFYLQTGNNQNRNLMFNAHNIVVGANTAGFGNAKGSATLESDVDKLISMYGIRSTAKSQKQNLVKVMDRESSRTDNVNGITTVLAFHEQLKKAAIVHEFNENPWAIMKGYRAEIFDAEMSFEIATENAGKKLLAAGYQLVNDNPVLKDPSDESSEDLFMYVIEDGGLTETVKGAFSVTSKKAKGRVDRDIPAAPPVEPTYAGDITLYRPQKTDFNYKIPVLGVNGMAVAQRYTMQQNTKNAYLRQKSPIHMVLGKMASQALDKVGSSQLNRKTVSTLKNLYKQDQASDNPSKSWIKVYSGSSDPRVAEAYDLLTDETRRHVKEEFGEPALYVTAEAFDTIFGYRKYSLANAAKIRRDDFDNYKSRTNAWERSFVSVVSAIPIKKANGWEPIGEQAALRIAQAEDVWQTLVKYIKNAIVIKSIIVWMGNASSNASILAVEGVGPTALAADTAVGWEATDRYVADRNLKDRIDYQLAMGLEWIQADVKLPNKLTQSKTLTRKQAESKSKQLQVELDNNPVEPLMREGQYQSLVEDIEIEGNQAGYSSRLQRGIDAVTGADSSNPVVKAVREGAETVLLADGTDAYELLKSGTTKSDFVSRYVLYKHLTTRDSNPLSHEDASMHVRASFINYDLPTHRGVQYMNDMGFLYFTKFLIRIQSIVVKLAVEHPIRMAALAATGVLDIINDIPVITETFIPTKSGYQIEGYSGISDWEDNPISKLLDAIRGIAPIAAGEAAFDNINADVDAAQKAVYG